jgi:cell division protein FtsB
MASPLRSLTDSIRTRTTAAGRRLAAAVRASRQFVVSLIALLALLAFMAAGPIRALDAADSNVEHLRATKRQLTASVTDLEYRRARLQDPQQVELLARTRFGLVKPGEQAYVVMTPEEDLRTDGEPDGEGEGRAWYRRLLDAMADMLPS